MIIHQSSSPENIERENLATHVELCAHRISNIDKRISEIEKQQDKSDSATATSRLLLLKVIGVAAAVLSLTVSLTIIILDRLK
jgi:hypothetical protein